MNLSSQEDILWYSSSKFRCEFVHVSIWLTARHHGVDYILVHLSIEWPSSKRIKCSLSFCPIQTQTHTLSALCVQINRDGKSEHVHMWILVAFMISEQFQNLCPCLRTSWIIRCGKLCRCMPKIVALRHPYRLKKNIVRALFMFERVWLTTMQHQVLMLMTNKIALVKAIPTNKRF